MMMTELRQNKQSILLGGLAKMDKEIKEITREQFKIAYVVCIEEVALTYYPKLLALEERCGVEIGTAYSSDR